MSEQKLNLGDQFETTFRYSQEQVNQFMTVTGDHNPIHYDENYAAATIFKRPIMHGFLSGAVFSRIFGTMFPGEGTIYLSQDLKFLRPMFVEEDYRAAVQVIEIMRETHRCKMATTIYNAQGKATLSGEALLIHPEKI